MLLLPTCVLVLPVGKRRFKRLVRRNQNQPFHALLSMDSDDLCTSTTSLPQHEKLCGTSGPTDCCASCPALQHRYPDQLKSSDSDLVASFAFASLIDAAYAEEGRDVDCVALSDRTLSQEALLHACRHLNLEYLCEAEIHRLWKRLHGGSRDAHNKRMNQNQFCKAVQQSSVLNGFVAQVNARVRSLEFKIPAAYNYDKPTCENYAASGLEFSPPFTVERQGGDPPQKRDYGYHSNYTLERQAWQDDVIGLTITRHTPQPRPWIVFTCGAMGCGKGFTFKRMSEYGHFPIEDIVRIDPDYFKVLMPEWNGYLQQGQDAGTMTHRESAYLQEICQEAALRRRQNTWVDGSLRDVAWFSRVFDDIRMRFPHYRIGIIHVHASEKAVRERVREREARTGRSVPEELLQNSLQAPSQALFELGSKCDWVARVDNEVTPQLLSFNQIDRTGSWGAMSSRWARVEPAPYEFPNKMSSFALESVNDIDLDGSHPSTSSYCNVKLRRRVHQDEEGAVWTYFPELKVAPLSLIGIAHSITGDVARGSLGIPDQAVWFTWIYAGGPQHQIFPQGGFLYFDQAKKLLSGSCIVGQCVRSSHLLEFSLPISKSQEEVLDLLDEEERWADVMLSDIELGGAKRYAWVSPGELPEAEGLGGFLYELQEGLVFFPLRVPSI